MDWFDLLAVQGTLKSLLQHHSSKAPIFWCSAFSMVQLSHQHMTIGKTIALTIWTFVGIEMSVLLICYLDLSELSFQGASVLISWLQSPSAMILEPNFFLFLRFLFISDYLHIYYKKTKGTE